MALNIIITQMKMMRKKRKVWGKIAPLCAWHGVPWRRRLYHSCLQNLYRLSMCDGEGRANREREGGEGK